MYLPSFVVFTRERVHTCLKIMQFHIVIDVLGTFATSILFGILILKGSVYCSDPILNTIASTLAYGLFFSGMPVVFISSRHLVHIFRCQPFADYQSNMWAAKPRTSTQGKVEYSSLRNIEKVHRHWCSLSIYQHRVGAARRSRCLRSRTAFVHSAMFDKFTPSVLLQESFHTRTRAAWGTQTVITPGKYNHFAMSMRVSLLMTFIVEPLPH